MLSKHLFVTLPIILLLSLGVQAAEFIDNFNTTHNYLTTGVTGTGWDGFIGQGPYETVDVLTSNIDQAGRLFIESTNGRWQDPFPPVNNLGPFLYKNVEGDFIAIVKVTSYQSGVNYNAGGLMARVEDDAAAGDGEDWVATTYFPMFSVNNKMDSTNNGARAEIGPWTAAVHPYLMLERQGDNFYGSVSNDGISWTFLLNNGNPVTRTDMAGLPLQVGLWHCTYSTNTGYVAFDDFKLTYTPNGAASDPNPGDEAQGVEPPVNLTWAGAEQAVWHDVYFGDNYDNVNDADNSGPPCSSCIYRARQSAENTSYAVADELLPDKTYYWRIDEIDSGGDLLEKGEVWSFTILGLKANNPSPESGASGIDLLPSLSWQSGIGADMHDIFFGDNYDDVLNAKKLYGDIDQDGDVDTNDLSIMVSQWLGGPCGEGLCADIYYDGEVDFKDFALLADTWLLTDNGIYRGSQAENENSFSPGLLNPSKTYYWRIDEADFDGPGIIKGDVWNFTTSAGGPLDISNNYFELTFDTSNGGFTKMQRTGDSFETNFLSNPGWLIGDIETTYRIGAGSWQYARTYESDDNRNIAIITNGQKYTIDITYPAPSSQQTGIRDFEVSQHWILDGNNLTLDVNIVNTTGNTLQLGDLVFPLPFNSNYSGLDTDTIQTKRVLRHGFFSGHASHSYWTRVNGIPAFLVMTTPSPDTRFEYWDNISSGDIYFKAYVYSAITGPATAGTWRQQHTSRVMSAGETINLKFNFTWADSLNEVRDILYEDDDIDIECVPGMTIPQDLFALIKLRTKQTIDSVAAEYPADTVIQYLGESQPDTHIYKVTFGRIGENIIRINHNGTEQTILEFFSTEPVETLIKKRASHMVNYEQVKNASKWYDGLFGEWDLRTSVLRTPDNTDGMDLTWWIYVICCDDPGNAHAPYLASKNVHFPVQAEITALEYYIENYVWGGLQYKDTEAYPYRVLGVPTWYYNRANDPTHYGRVFDYPHIVMLYYHMYQIEKYYPDMISHPEFNYLDRAYNTAMQYYEVSSGWGYEVGTYNEVVFVDLIKSLREEGWNTQADALEARWEQKVKYFIFDKEYPYGSEYAMDSTAFESSHALVKWAMENGLDPDPQHPVIDPERIEEFMHGQMMANLAVRGCIEPAFYTYGSDYRVWGQTRYTLSYMSQMGGWAVLDYGLHWTDQQSDYIRLGYGSYLSSWALMNSDPTGTNGYWYPAAANDGAIGWAFKPEKNGPIWLQNRYLERGIWYYNGEIDLGLGGALRTSRAVVVNDPVFGLFGYGCDVTLSGSDYLIVPKDGLRERLSVMPVGLSLELNRDSYTTANVRNTADFVSFNLQNERADAHTTGIVVKGLAAGTYSAKVNSVQQFTFTVSAGESKTLELNIPAGSGVTVSLERL